MKDHPDMKDYKPADLMPSSFLATCLLQLMVQENLTFDSLMKRHRSEINNGDLSDAIFIAMRLFKAAPRPSIRFLMVQAITTYEYRADELPRKNPWNVEIHEDEDNDIAVSFY